MKKLVSILLIFSMIFGSFAFAFAEDVDIEDQVVLESVILDDNSEKIDTQAMAEREASLGEYSLIPANAFTPVKQQNLLTAEDGGHAYDSSVSLNNENTEPVEVVESTPDFVDGEVLFSRSYKEGVISSAKTDKQLANAGVTEIVELINFEETDTTWFKAKIDIALKY